jgi:hypothetical protein
MKYLIFSGLLSLGIIGSVQLKNSDFESELSEFHQKDKQDTIHWSSTRKLTWNDFKSKPDNRSEYKAMTFSKVEIKHESFDNYFVINITSVFSCPLSWSKNMESSRLLKHEQLHFDITEIAARYIRKEFIQHDITDISALSNSLQDIYRKYNRIFRDSINLMYDEETEHGTIADKQKEWEVKIAKELKLLEAYSTPKVVIKRNGK